ncbi:MAG: hypothetical protein KR126chlam2_00176, partial [Chlamydiae bacterium]|nr:hypothetical protein [Chlamydiota bacterium]
MQKVVYLLLAVLSAFQLAHAEPDIERNLLRINSEQFMWAIHIFFGPMAESKIEF